MKKIPIGISEFSKVRENDFYYIDKSLLIAELLSNANEVTLITRPRRFGKTLNMTMLREFFSRAVDSKEIFAGLKIMSTEYATELNKYPVLYFSFKDAKGSKSDLLSILKRQIHSEYRNYKGLEQKLDEDDKIIYQNIKKSLLSSNHDDFSALNTSIHFLSEIIYKHYKIRPILLIDEYDTPLISSYEGKFYEELRSFFTNLYSSALKDNPNLNFAVMTGIQRVAKENIFSGLNNLKVCTVMDQRFNDKFGLTETETRELLKYYGFELNADIYDMYNGYNFSGESIFNPWSIINYADTGRLEYFWVNTSSNRLIFDLVKTEQFDIAEVFEKLVTEGKVNLPVDLSTTFFEMQNIASFWGLLVNAGYLTLEKRASGVGRLNSYRIPNGEVKEEFKKLAAVHTKQDATSLEKMFDALLNKDIRTFANTYQKMLLTAISFYDRRENAYHMLLLGMSFYLFDRYEIKSNRGMGDGRADIVFRAKYPDEPHLVIEVKYEDVESEDELKKLAQSALEQIKTKKYYSELVGDILIVGVAHAKKEVKVAIELIENLGV